MPDTFLIIRPLHSTFNQPTCKLNAPHPHSFFKCRLHAPTNCSSDYFLHHFHDYAKQEKNKTFTRSNMFSRSSERAYCSSTLSSVSTYHEPLDASLQETKPSEEE